MKQMIMNRMAVMCVATSALALSFLLVGCDREVSNTKSSSVSNDGNRQRQPHAGQLRRLSS